MQKRFFIFLIFLIVVSAHANDGFGIRGDIRRVQTAKLNLRKTSFIYLGGSVYPYDINGEATLGWGMANRLNLIFNSTVAQFAKNDVNGKEPGILAPMDFSLTAKFGGVQFFEKKLIFSGDIFVLPQGKAPYNLPLLPYRSEKIAVGGKLLTSFYTRPGYFINNLSFHLNLGMIYHNNAGVAETDTSNKEFQSATEGLYGFGFNYPFMAGSKAFEARLEVYGNGFFNAPNPAVYSRENYAYVNASLRMGLFDGINIDLGGSFLVLNEKDATNYAYVTKPTKLTTNYAPWLVTMGVEIDFNRLITKTYLSQEDFQEEVISKFDQLLTRKTSSTGTVKEEAKKVEDKKEPASIKKLAEQRKSSELELEAKVRAVTQGIPLKPVNVEEPAPTAPAPPPPAKETKKPK